jgi:uncharacterized protein YraI
MTITKTLLASGAALLLSAGVAAAAPATAQTDLNVRSGPGPRYPVVGSIPAGETVDVGGCTGSWCQVSFSGGSGFTNRRYLAMADGAPSVGVAVAPSYGYEDSPAYATDDYYDYGYSYGPSVGFYGGGPRFGPGPAPGRDAPAVGAELAPEPGRDSPAAAEFVPAASKVDPAVPPSISLAA